MEDRGLMISRKKTEYLCFGKDRDSEVSLHWTRLGKVDEFKYLGSTVAKDGNLDAEITRRIQAGWNNWKKMSGVLCDRRINIKVKGKYIRR